MNIRSKLVLLYNFILTRRYTINITGEELLKTKGAKLVLPNHQSHIDPQLMGVIMALNGDFVPVVAEKFLKIPIISIFIKQFDPISVSDLRGGNRDALVLKNIFSQVQNALKLGKSVIIYPSGQITHTPTEIIENKQSAYVVVSSLPNDVRVLGVRISGLWGSMWSVAWHGKRPHFLFTFIKAIFFFFANFIFFIPKRKVNFEFVDITEEAKLKAATDRHRFNNYMESFFNKNGPEKATYIKHLFYGFKSKRKYPKNLI
jgi:long-chain-fatty-acid--[acyl-carrier-protein] ligase